MSILFKKSKKDASVKATHIRQALEPDFQQIDNLKKAKNDPQAYLVMHGDDGGQIYLTVPVSKVTTTVTIIKELLKVIDDKNWCDPIASEYYFEHGFIGKTIPAGMGGGLLTDDLWLHPELDGDLEAHVRKALKVGE